MINFRQLQDCLEQWLCSLALVDTVWNVEQRFGKQKVRLARMPGHVSAGKEAGKETENAAFVPSSVYTSCWEVPVPEHESQARGIGLSQGDRGKNAEAPGQLRSAEHPRTLPGAAKSALTSAAAIAAAAGSVCAAGPPAGRLRSQSQSRS